MKNVHQTLFCQYSCLEWFLLKYFQWKYFKRNYSQQLYISDKQIAYLGNCPILGGLRAIGRFNPGPRIQKLLAPEMQKKIPAVKINANTQSSDLMRSINLKPCWTAAFSFHGPANSVLNCRLPSHAIGHPLDPCAPVSTACFTHLFIHSLSHGVLGLV